MYSTTMKIPSLRQGSINEQRRIRIWPFVSLVWDLVKVSIGFVIGCLFMKSKDNAMFGLGDSYYDANFDSKNSGVKTIASTGSGWNQIDIFVGQVPDDAEILSVEKRMFSQARQDEIVLALFNYKRDGYYVDLAANDAQYMSNTYGLENCHNWKGLCIEPNQRHWYNLSHYRLNCTIVGAVVTDKRMESTSSITETIKHFFPRRGRQEAACSLFFVVSF
jgi:hypothetical protein